MELESGYEADDSFRHEHSGLGKRMSRVNGNVRKVVEAACRPNNLVVPHKTGQGLPLNIFRDEIFEAQHSPGF
jgi:hypothetical protein